MNIWMKKYILGLLRDVAALLVLVFIKAAEWIIFSRVLLHYLNLQLDQSVELVYVIVLVLIMAPFTFIILRQKKTMKEAEHKYRMLAEDSLIGIYTIFNNKFTYANNQLSVMSGYSPSELCSIDVLEFVHPDDRSFVTEHIIRKLHGEEQVSRFEIRAVKKDKSIINVEIYGTVTTQDGRPEIIGSVLDITERKRNENLLVDLAYKDQLTGLPNRRYLEENFYIKNRQTAAFLFLDLDGFKEVNDSFGHETGDLLLKEIASRLKSSTRAGDILSRLGGDEFILFLTNIDKEGAMKAAGRIIDDINKPFNIELNEIFVTTSIGIAFYPDHGREFDTLLRNADLAMYQAKNNGKNGICVSTELVK